MYSRAQRRADLARIKQRMVRYVRAWFQSSRHLQHDLEFIGKMAQCHGTHDCYMCKQEKYEGKPKVRRVSARLFR